MPNLTRGQVSQDRSVVPSPSEGLDDRGIDRIIVDPAPAGPSPSGRPGLDRSLSAKVGAALAAGLVLALISLGLQDRPADGPTVELADEVMSGRAIRIDESTPTSLSAQSFQMPEPDLNPNAIFVSPVIGDDGNDGDGFETPLRSFQAALDRVEPGETIYLMSGTYTDLVEPRNAHYIATRGGTPDAWVTIERAPEHEPVIVASNGNGLEIQADYVSVIGLRVRGEGYDTGSNPWGNGILVRNSHHVHLAANEISGMPLNGISTVESSNLEIVDNEIYENAFWNTAQGSGISLWHSKTEGEAPDADGYHDRIIGNRVYRNENKVTSRWKDYRTITDGNGIIIDEGDDTGYDGRVLIANNVIFDNGGRGIMVFESRRVDILHNTLYHNGRTVDLDGGPAEFAAGRAGDIRAFNNILWPRLGVTAVRLGETEGVGFGGNVVVAGGDTGPIGEADLVVNGNPGLTEPSVDENVADFRPTPSSRAVGAAVAVTPRLSWDKGGLDRLSQPPTAGAHVADGAGSGPVSGAGAGAPSNP